MRHTLLTRLGESGCDIWTLARIAGHNSIAISSRYVQFRWWAVQDSNLRPPASIRTEPVLLVHSVSRVEPHQFSEPALSIPGVVSYETHQSNCNDCNDSKRHRWDQKN